MPQRYGSLPIAALRTTAPGWEPSDAVTLLKVFLAAGKMEKRTETNDGFVKDGSRMVQGAPGRYAICTTKPCSRLLSSTQEQMGVLENTDREASDVSGVMFCSKYCAYNVSLTIQADASGTHFDITRYRLTFCVLVRAVQSAAARSGTILRYFEKAEDCHYHYPLCSAARKTTSRINISVRYVAAHPVWVFRVFTGSTGVFQAVRCDTGRIFCRSRSRI